jgi:parallel beta-helix repeat protein
VSLPESITAGLVGHRDAHAALHQRFNDEPDAKFFGATGDGTTDDSAAIADALAEAAGGTLVFSPGIYVLTNVTVPANTTIVLARGATLKLKGSSSLHGLNVSNAGVSIFGPGTLDGNRANQSSNVMPIYISAASVTVDGVTVTGSKYHGIHAEACSGLRIKNCYVTASTNTGIYVDPTSAAISDILIANNTVDRSAEVAATIAGEGIQCYSDGTYTMRYLCVEGNHVIMPTSPTAEVAPISVVRASYSAVTGNIVSGGQLGITLDVCTFTAMTGNSAYNQSNYCLELADCLNCSATGNTADCNSLATRGIALTGTGAGSFYNTIAGNTVKAPTVWGISVGAGGSNTFSGNTVHLSGTTDVNGIQIYESSHNTVTGNTVIDAFGDNKGIVLTAGSATSCSDNTVTGNNVFCTTGDAASRGIRITCAHASGHCDRNVIVGNNVRGNNGTGSHGVSLAVTAGGGTIDKTLVGGNVLTNVATAISETSTTNTLLSGTTWNQV